MIKLSSILEASKECSCKSSRHVKSWPSKKDHVKEGRAVRPAPGKQPAKNPPIQTAYKLGQKAFADGRKMIPAHDPDFQHFVFTELKSKLEKQSDLAKVYVQVAKAWADGFTRANLDAPVKESTGSKTCKKCQSNMTPVYQNQEVDHYFCGFCDKRSFVKEARNYKKEYESYHSKPEQKKRRAQRNKSRRHMEREGKVRKGDNRDVHHRDNNPHNQKSSNVTVMARSKNRSIK